MAWRTSFVGRERELADIGRLLDRTRLLTLTGPGGTGKTRLAFEALQRHADTDRRDVVVELASVRDEQQLVPAIATALGLRDSGSMPLTSAVSEWLGRSPTLLVLDNLEQLISAVPWVGKLLDAAPSLTVMATSRVPLGLSGEHEYAVPPLELPTEAILDPASLATVDAVSLFVDRARAIHAGFELTPHNADVVAAICRRLDGLPLAIELAASRLRILSPEALLKRLDQRLAILTAGAADAPPRQRTLRATISWSYDLLSEDDRSMFRLCGVFVGGFTLDGAGRIAPARSRDEPFDALARLSDHNLITVSPGADHEPRFRMLESIREFALERLSPDEERDARDRHAAWAVELAETGEIELRGPHHGSWLDRLTEELDNFRAALAWTSRGHHQEIFARLAAALATYWRYYGDLREGQRWLAEAQAIAPRTPAHLRARVLRAAGWLEVVAGNLATGDRLLLRAFRLFDDLGDPRERGATLYHLGMAARDGGRIVTARRRLLRGLEDARRVRDVPMEARLLLGLAWVAGEAGHLDDRARLAQSAADTARRGGDLQRVALAMNDLGWAAEETGDRAGAIERWSESVALLRDLGERAFLGSILLSLAWGQLRFGELASSRDHLLEGARTTRDTGAVPDLAVAVVHIADWFSTVGSRQLGIRHWLAAEAIRQRHGLLESQISPHEHVRKELGLVNPGLLRKSDLPDLTVDAALDAAIGDLEAFGVRETVTESRRKSAAELTPREREVLELVVAGRSNAEIGDVLYISRKTASVHVANIKVKLGAESRIGIVTTALQQRLVEDQQPVSADT
jgi:predicted ATPase/DNA-binding CsgD family transcriptional regulator